ncbi:hypothetical protein GGS26DRAFT_597616 [Hypomontagnella submonticulosa]|nr:hypothetical protein GGS26DRAFT_597616 [Hypomontagnella submonticulosa]
MVGTADSVRRRFGEPASQPRNPNFRPKSRVPMKGHSFRQSMTELGAMVDKKGKSLSFDRLPYDIKHSIFEVLQSMPSWIHFRMAPGESYGSARLVDFKGSTQEIHANKEWYEARSLRRGLSRMDYSGPTTLGAIAAETLNILVARKPTLEQMRDRHWGMDSPFHIQLKRKVKTPLVKRRIDWFFFDGPLDVLNSGQRELWRDFQGILSIRTCVFRLDNIYEAIHLWLDSVAYNTLAGNMPPSFVWDRDSQVEEIVILVGEFRPDVKPSEMEEIASFRIEEFPGYGTGESFWTFNRKFDRIPTEIPLFRSQTFMMEHVSGRLKMAIYDAQEERYKWLNSDRGLLWLTYVVHDWKNPVSAWLDSLEGHMWLQSHGSQFLASESGRWWLASDYGYPWLETKTGNDWLATEPGNWFINSTQALHWANRKPSWLRTSRGQKWHSHQFHSGALQNLPAPPQEAQYPPPRQAVPPGAFSMNHRLLSWRFVMCPPQSVGQSSSSRDHKGKGKEVAR